MSDLAYTWVVSPADKPLVWLHGEVKTPPFSAKARLEAGFLLRQLQQGRKIAMPHSRPMPSVAKNVHELRIRSEEASWRILYRPDPDAVVILEVFSKQSQKTPQRVVQTCVRRLAAYDAISQEPT
jgi:phage-related protein